MGFLENIKVYLKEVRIELRKVIWPTREQTINYTWAVIGLSAALAIFLGALDFIFSSLLNQFLFR